MRQFAVLIAACALVFAGCDLLGPEEDEGDDTAPTALDSMFGTDGSTVTAFSGGQSQVQALLVDSSDRIYAIGWQYASSGTRLAMARFTAEGVLDTTFGTSGLVTDDFDGNNVEPTGAVFDQNDDILVSGIGGAEGSNPWAGRYETDGSLDTTFATDGHYTLEFASVLGNSGFSTERAFAVVTRPADNAAYLVGTTNQELSSGEYATFILQVGTTGVLNTSWGTSGIAVNLLGASGSVDLAFDVGLADGGATNVPIVVGGAHDGNDYDFVISKYTSTGALDTTFGTDGVVKTDIGADDVAYEIHVFSDGDFLVAGLTGSDGPPVEYDIALARYDSTGSLDTTFGTDGVATYDDYDSDLAFYDARKTYAIAVDDSDRIYVAGAAGSSSIALVRFAADGSLDTSFADGGVSAITSGSIGSLKALAFQSDGKIIAGGETGSGSDRDFYIGRHVTE